MGAHFPSPSTIPLLSTTYQQQEPRVSHHLWKQVTVEIDFSSVFYSINSYFSHDFLWFYLPNACQLPSYFYILYSNNDRPSVQQHRYYNCYIFKDVKTNRSLFIFQSRYFKPFDCNFYFTDRSDLFTKMPPLTYKLIHCFSSTPTSLLFLSFP